ncbi:MAG: DNA mismatch repair protein MutS, partial [bacterium]
MEETRITPMIRQYLQIKDRYRDAILFFRLGDFYEMFFEDAERASKVLDIALTSRNRNNESSVPLCGVPYHAANPYIGKLLDAGYKVAICEQMEDPKTAKGVVQREVVRVITPGTITEGDSLDARDNNFLAAVSRGRKDYGLALTDVTTGEFRFTQVEGYPSLIDEIGRVRPAEVLLSEEDREFLERLRGDFPAVHFSPIAPLCFSRRPLDGRQPVLSPSGPGEEEWSRGISAASAIVAYLEESLPDALKALREAQPYRASQYLLLDETTRRNLELLRDFQGSRKGSLLGVLDYT